jgi:superoxide dismutase, Cu-Zn family
MLTRLAPLALTVLVGCLPGGDITLQAEAPLVSKSGSTMTGTALFSRQSDMTTLQVNITGATPGEHGIHIHAVGDCSAADALTTGGHWNPVPMLGELGNITVGADGKGSITLQNPMWTILDGAETDVIGKSIVVHALVNAGARIGCGVIVTR